MDKYRKICFLTAIFAVGAANFAFFILSTESAQAKKYQYDLIAVKIKINSDSTFDVEEKQTFNFIGNFHAADRIIPLNKIDAITDIEVVDTQTGQPLKRVSSSKRLNELDSSSWGSFVAFREKGKWIIDWYFNLSDTKRAWIIKYKVHGGLGFFKDFDQLYWNIFSGYNAPILKSESYVYLPQNAPLIQDLKINVYADTKNQAGQLKLVNNLPFTAFSQILDDKTFYFSAENIPSDEPLTIYAAWPKGIVNQTAYWIDFLKIFWGYILGGLIILGSLIAGFLRWYFTEKYNFGRGVIIAQYEPPQKLKPAMAEAIVKEEITNKAWPATIIDLAVRGYVKIKEESLTLQPDILPIILLFSIGVFSGTILISLFLYSVFASFSVFVIVPIFSLLFFLWNIKKIKSGQSLKNIFISKNYIIEKVEPFENDNDLEEYEKKFLKIIFKDKNYFSTKESKNFSISKKQEMRWAMNELEEELFKETESDTKAFDVGISQEKWGIFIIFFLILIFLFKFDVINISNPYHFLFLSAFASFLGLFVFIKYEARLNKEGQILKEEWLGFKLYLETAEKYRLQNLTPELFEKYLPYAMIFGIEKKWASAFETLNISSPSWYGSTAAAGAVGFGGAASFSPSVFSSSFSSSFSSAFSSASGGGGGGGLAGGGGGGGGGGAR